MNANAVGTLKSLPTWTYLHARQLSKLKRLLNFTDAVLQIKLF